MAKQKTWKTVDAYRADKYAAEIKAAAEVNDRRKKLVADQPNECSHPDYDGMIRVPTAGFGKVGTENVVIDGKERTVDIRGYYGIGEKLSHSKELANAWHVLVRTNDVRTSKDFLARVRQYAQYLQDSGQSESEPASFVEAFERTNAEEKILQDNAIRPSDPTRVSKVAEDNLQLFEMQLRENNEKAGIEMSDEAYRNMAQTMAKSGMRITISKKVRARLEAKLAS